MLWSMPSNRDPTLHGPFTPSLPRVSTSTPLPIFLLAAIQNHFQILSKTTKRFSHSKKMNTTPFSTRTIYAFFGAWLCINAPVSTVLTPTHDLFQQWNRDNLPTTFQGSTYRLESVVQVNVDVFNYDEDKTPPCLVPSRRSAYTYSTTMRVLSYEHHFCFITNISKATHAFACHRCGKLCTKAVSYTHLTLPTT